MYWTFQNYLVFRDIVLVVVVNREWLRLRLPLELLLQLASRLWLPIRWPLQLPLRLPSHVPLHLRLTLRLVAVTVAVTIAVTNAVTVTVTSRGRPSPRMMCHICINQDGIRGQPLSLNYRNYRSGSEL